MVDSAPNMFLLYYYTLKWLKPVQWRYRLKNAMQSQIHRRFPELVRRSLLRRVPGDIVWRADAKPVVWFEKRYDGTHGMFCVRDIFGA